MIRVSKRVMIDWLDETAGDLMLKLKRCRKCKKIKCLTEFPKAAKQKDGYHYYCKVCNNKQRKNTT